MNLHRLRGTRCYLVGPMDKCPNGGVQWRAELTPWLNTFGVTVLDPTCKPIDICPETPVARAYLEYLKKVGDYDSYSKEIKLLRCVDLRMVDISDFIIVHLDFQIPMFGTIEEITTANRSKKPILVHCQQGKQECSGWLFGMIPHSYVFDRWNHLKAYLSWINDNAAQGHDKRWYFFNFDIPKEALPPRN